MPIDRGKLERMANPAGPRDDNTFCVACGYNLTGSVTDRCPECGNFFVAKEWQNEKARVRSLALRIEEALSWVRIALKCGAVLLGVLLLVKLPGVPSLLIGAVRLACVLFGFANIFLGLGALRVGSLPDWAREELSVKSNTNLAVSAISGGAVLAGLGLFLP